MCYSISRQNPYTLPHMHCAVVYSPLFAKHITPQGHPECPQRAVVIAQALEKAGLSYTKLEPVPVDRATIELAHSTEYVDLVLREISKLGDSSLAFLSTGDVVISPHSYSVACLAVGAAVTAVDWVCAEKNRRAFAVVRPPGHHATKERGMGFCLFNNVAVAARYVQKKYGIERVAIIDWDVHHGNGTEEIFFSDPSVLYFSTHQAGIYPNTGWDSSETVVNCPIQPEQSREEIFFAFEETLKAHLERFQPQFFLISCGFDAHCQDPLGGLSLTENDFYALTKIVCSYADRWAEGRLVSVLEGGYNLAALQRSSVQHVKALQE